MKRVNTWLLVIVVLGAILRFFRLGANPPGLYWDEVSLGWNAYSVLTTGMDEHGRFLPIDTFFAFGDYKPPLYIYAAVPSIWLFGLNEFAVRFPSALAGTLLIVVTYYLAKAILSEKSEDSEIQTIRLQKLRQSDSQTVRLSGVRQSGENFFSLLSAFLLAISPWSITLSRVGFESNLAVLLNALGALFFLYAVYRSARWLPVSVLSFVLAAYTFNANRVLSPLFLIIFSLVYCRKAVKEWKWWLTGAVLGAALVLPMIPHLRSAEGKLRWNEVNIFSDLTPILTVNDRRERAGNNLVARVFHHRYWEFGKIFMAHYLDHLDFNYLFIDGDPNPRISVPGIGQLYLIELPFFLVGLISLIGLVLNSRGSLDFARGKKSALTLIFWLLLAAVPAGMARETPHALRSASVLPVPQIITAMGVVGAIMKVQESTRKYKKVQKGLLPAICVLVFTSVVHFQFIYWRYYPKEWAGEWLTAYKPLVHYIKQEEKNFKTIYITPDLGRPYIYFLFYGDYPPKEYIGEAIAGGRTGDAFGFFNVNSFGRYKFYVPDLNSVSGDDLVVTRADPPPPGFSLVKTIVDVNGHPEFNIIRKQ